MMEWTNDIPKVPGAYWFFDKIYDEFPSVRMVRNYDGDMAVDNWVIRKSKYLFWFGPITEPEPPQAKEE